MGQVRRNGQTTDFVAAAANDAMKRASVEGAEEEALDLVALQQKLEEDEKRQRPTSLQGEGCQAAVRPPNLQGPGQQASRSCAALLEAKGH